ncbi:hypothetical protein [Halanaerobacter jeridensis]|uniref:Uncharacterized protein n=1 Tax=Halanaerobacter jeridensis TaxID=706427 RepID=A0A939BS07_9FIRM|nr:hypothetical protein [Halanaerobacter jeridensis]MBM7556596.1 hypothetical protein [Halanaerobacter jeridensis]
MGWLKFTVINIILVLIYLVVATGLLNSPEPGFVYDFKEKLKFNEVITTNSNAVVVVGTVKGETYEDGRDAFVAKINTSGEILWSHSFGGTGDDEFYNIQQTADGFILVGSNAEALDLSTDAYVVKIDKSGAKEWEKKFDNQFASVFYDLIVNAEDNIVLVGEIEYLTAEDDLNTNAYVVEVNSQGQKQWTEKFGGSNFTSAQAIISSGVKDYYIAGHTNQQAGQKAWLLKLKDRKQEWSKNYFSQGSSSLYDLELLENGHLIAVGEANDEHSSAYVVQLNQSGEKRWEKLIQDKKSSYSVFYTAEEISAGQIALGGVISVPLKFGNLNSISYKDVVYSVIINNQGQKIKAKKFAEKKSGALKGSTKINPGQIVYVGNLSQYEVDAHGYMLMLTY